MYRVAITGLGCLSPNGMGKANFFQALAAGKSGIRQVSLFPVDELSCKIAGEIPEFDSILWLSKKDLPHVPRTVPFALAASHEALEDANLDPKLLSKEELARFGVIIGSGGNGVEFLERQYGYYFNHQVHKTSVYAIPSNTPGSLSSEISMRFNLNGLSHVISTGCTSSTDAMGYAFQQIQTGRLDRVLCGGVDAPITPATISGFCMMKVISCKWNHQPEKGSRPFSKDRDGFILGEGAWIFLLEREELALARGAHIYARIHGYGATCDAHHRVRLDESGEQPARAMTLALEEASIDPKAIDYINLHGTATLLNDRIETRAIRNAFGKHAYCVATSSTKSMIGHPQGASGSAGIAAAIFAMESGVLPPTINLSSPDPECDLDYTPEVGRQQEVSWALCNCIGFGSKNSALLLHRAD